MTSLNSYYFDFEPTGVDAIDEILAAVANAGSGAHNTSDWNDMGYDKDIQEAANKAAEFIKEKK